MPAKSVAQRRLMAIAEHHPSKVMGKNRGVLSMSKGKLHDFAKTKEKGLPNKKGVEDIGRYIRRRNKKQYGK